MIKAIFISFFSLINIVAFASDDLISKKLQSSFIWAAGTVKTVVFRKEINIKALAEQANVCIFADSYYALYINGHYILSGPSRFDPKWPEYDKTNVAPYLKKGLNQIAVLVYGGISNGQRMKHMPGFTFYLRAGNFAIASDASWKCNSDTRFMQASSKWNGINETIDASREVGDCITSDYDDAKWPLATVVNGNNWGALHLRSIPLLSENEILPKQILPDTINGPVNINFGRNYLLQVEMDIQALAGTVINIGGLKYIAKTGRQKFRTFDSFAIKNAALQVKTSSPVKVYAMHFYNRVYPLKLKGSFSCSDTVLNRLWAMSVHTMQQITEDGYQDCPWERVEWMGDAAIIEYPLTRINFTGPDNTYGDPRLIRKMLRDIAQSADTSGSLKAHHPSDRFDKHAYIEDYACNWIQALQEYYQYTGDKEFVKEMWPILKGQLAWFLKQRTENGLIKGREFIGEGNPLAYTTCQGATLNAFVYGSFLDGAALSAVVKDPNLARFYKQVASDLYNAFNTVLWNDSAKVFNGSTSYKPTYTAELIALDKGIVAPKRISVVNNWLKDNYTDAAKTLGTPIYPYFLKYLYTIDTEQWDDNAMNVVKEIYKPMYGPNNKGFTVFEHFGAGSRDFHDYGTVPAIFMSTNILGVTLKLPISSKLIIIKPQLGYLTEAHGTVVTEHGPIKVNWVRTEKKLRFKLKIPLGNEAEIYLPVKGNHAVLTINGKNVRYAVSERHVIVKLMGGEYNGSLNF